MPRLILLIGIPGSGKSTYCQTYYGELADHKIISTDAIRGEITGEYGEFNPANEPTVWAIARERITQFLIEGSSVILDATNTRRKKRRPFIHQAQRLGASVEALYIDCPLEIALERNQKRDRQVPRDVLIDLYQALDPPEPQEGFEKIIHILV